MGEGVGAQPKPPCGRFLRPSAAAAAPPPGAAPRSLLLLHTLPGGRRQAANRQKKQGREGEAFPAEGARQRARASGRRPGGAFGAADAGKACVPRLRRGGLRPSLSRIPISPHLSRTNLPPATIKFSPTRRPHPAKSLRTLAKKHRPHRDGALLTFFGFSPAWQGRHGCGRGSPHGPAPPPALCRRRG